jgi:DNA-directed RNA polymerase specialized sigma24 family protein
MPEHDDLGAIEQHLCAEDSDPYLWLLEHQRRERLMRSLDELPQPQRECLRLALYEGLSLVEIARRQDCTENTAKARLFRARQKVRSSLARFLDSDGAWVSETDARRTDSGIEPDPRWAGATACLPEAAAA